ncbi:PEGA domain-containing protein [bacterium]|nr:MAG: PEGA domain-containing protein [bacterium]
MTRKSYIILLILALGNCVSVVAQGEYGYLTLSSHVHFETIMIDDSSYTRSDKIALQAGTHVVVVQNPDRTSFQALDFTKTITIRPGENEKVVVYFDMLAEINSVPNGASVSYDSELLGVTPFYLRLREYKERTLHFKKPGYEDFLATVSDSTINNNYLFISLNPNLKNRSNNQNQFVNLEWQERGPHKYKSAIWISNALGVVFGASAAYYKKKGDDTFEKAKIARRLGDTDAQKRHLAKTRKYDRYAVIGFIGMQTNVAALVYFLLKSR